VFAPVNVLDDPENLAAAVDMLNKNAPFRKGFVMGFILRRKRFAFLFLDGQYRILVDAVHPLVSRIRQQQGVGVQQQAATLEDRKIMLTAFADNDREDGERQRANDELRLNRVAFFFPE